MTVWLVTTGLFTFSHLYITYFNNNKVVIMPDFMKMVEIFYLLFLVSYAPWLHCTS